MCIKLIFFTLPFVTVEALTLCFRTAKITLFYDITKAQDNYFHKSTKKMPTLMDWHLKMAKVRLVLRVQQDECNSLMGQPFLLHSRFPTTTLQNRHTIRLQE